MQTTITKISMKISNDTDRAKAYASIIINNSVKINGIIAIQQKNSGVDISGKM